MKLEELTSPEIAEIPRDVVVVFPVGSMEQHSLHLPVCTDTLIVGEVCRRLEAALQEDVLLLPVMWLGYSRHHMKYQGTVSASLKTHLEIMADVVCSMIEHGFQKILLVNGHGGNTANISVLLQRLMEEHSEVEVFACPIYSDPSADKIEKIRDKGPGGSGHAGETETSIVMALKPGLVKEDRLDADGGQARLSLTGVIEYRRMDKRTTHGGAGDPTSATAEKGEKFLQEIVRGLEDVVQKIRAGVPRRSS